MLHCLRLILLFVGFISTFAPLALTVDDLGAARVPVTDNSDAERARGVAAAFDRVLVKITGDSASLADSRVAGLRRRAREFNTLYGYERSPEGALLLRADFDAARVSAALRAEGMPVWGRERPGVEALFLLRDASGKLLPAAEETSRALHEALLRQAGNRGIPLALIPLTAELQAKVEAAPASSEVLDHASETPGATPVRLVVLLDALEGEAGWRIDWRVAIDGEAATGEGRLDLPGPLLEGGLEAAFDAIGRHYVAAVASAGEVAFRIHIEGVNSPAAWARTITYLETLDTLSQVRLARLGDGIAEFELSAHGGPAAFAQAVGFGQVLQAVPGTTDRFSVVQR